MATLARKTNGQQSLTILGIDPGKRNAGYCVLRVQPKPFKYQILEHGMLNHPVDDLTGPDVLKRLNQFKSELRRVKNKHGVEYIIAERFMNRGGGGSMGTTIEVVGCMLALMANIGIKNVRFVVASQWKNQWNKINDLKEFYDSVPIAPHQIDACGIAMYGASLYYESLPYYGALSKPSTLIKNLISSNTEKPKNEKRDNTAKATNTQRKARQSKKETRTSVKRKTNKTSRA